MEHYYTDERNAQIVIALMKAHNIRKMIASPGTTNICLIASMQNDPYFEIYSAAEERSAGYIACGLAAESGEPVAISCTGATASRNYLPPLTEAFYRKLPILAITSSRRGSRIGHNFDQVIDRTQLPKDVAKLSVQLPLVIDLESEWECVIAANKAMLELDHHGKGPVHINLETNYSCVYNVKELPNIRAIYRINEKSEMPEIKGEKIAIIVGAHLKWSKKLTERVDLFCAAYNAVVLCDHTSNYKGKYRILANLMGCQRYNESVIKRVDLLIHIGDILAPAYSITAENVWRVNPDGELRDTYGKLRYVFEMEEEDFFLNYLKNVSKNNLKNTFFDECMIECSGLQKRLKDVVKQIPFSNAWIASQTAAYLPANSVLHLGIQNSLRCWNYFEVPNSVLGYSNTGGFGIDGGMSSTVGAALANCEQIYFCVLGDLAFFYDMSSLGNRHVGNNIRILLINNGKGAEFKLTGNPGSMFGIKTDNFISAAGHYGNRSKSLVKHYAEDLGFEYLCVSTKEDYSIVLKQFVDPKESPKSIILEAFTESEDEDIALTLLQTILVDENLKAKREIINKLKEILGEKGVRIIKKFFLKSRKLRRLD